MIAAELRGGNKPSLNEALGWIGTRVDDIYGASVGRLEDVWIDPGTGAPRWLLVKEGRFGGRTTLIPFEDATAGTGHVWVPYEREIVGAAPEIEPGAPLTHQVEASLRSHYSSRSPVAIDRPPPDGSAGVPPPGDRRGTTTIRIHGAPEDDSPIGYARREPEPPHAAPYLPPRQPEPYRPPRQPEPGEPSYRLPARPAPPIAAPSEPLAEPYGARPPDPPSQPREPSQYREAPLYREPAPQPLAPDPYESPPVGHGRLPQHPGYAPRDRGAQPGPQGDWPPEPAWRPRPEPAATTPADPIASLGSLASAPGVHYVEIELAGELSIRGELRSVRVVPPPDG